MLVCRTLQSCFLQRPLIPFFPCSSIFCLFSMSSNYSTVYISTDQNFNGCLNISYECNFLYILMLSETQTWLLYMWEITYWRPGGDAGRHKLVYSQYQAWINGRVGRSYFVKFVPNQTCRSIRCGEPLKNKGAVENILQGIPNILTAFTFRSVRSM